MRQMRLPALCFLFALVTQAAPLAAAEDADGGSASEARHAGARTRAPQRELARQVRRLRSSSASGAARQERRLRSSSASGAARPPLLREGEEEEAIEEGDEETEEEKTLGEERAAGETEEEQESSGEEVASDADLSFAITLLGGTLVVLSVITLLTSGDAILRSTTYKLLRSVVLIFGAVLIFGGFNQFLEYWLLSEHEEHEQAEQGECHMGLLIRFAHRAVWIFASEGAIMVFSEIMATAAMSEERKKVIEDREHFIQIKTKVNAWGPLLGHIVGFASVAFWSSLQHLHFFARSPWLTFLIVPIHLLLQALEHYLLRLARSKLYHRAGGHKDELEELVDDVILESEADVMAVTSGFITVASLRYLINGVQPNAEGAYTHKVLLSFPGLNAIKLYGCGLVFLALFAVVIILPKVSSKRRVANQGLAEGEEKEEEEEEDEPRGCKEEVLEKLKAVFQMAFAWSMFYATLGVAAAAFQFLDEVLLSIVLAVGVTLFSFVIIYVLHKLVDMKETGPAVDETMRGVIAAIAVLIGFAWEQDYDAAIVALGSRTHHEVIWNLLVTVVTAGCILERTLHHTTSVIQQDGWRFGVTGSQAKQGLEGNDERSVKAYLEVMKHFATFGEHTVEPAPKGSTAIGEEVTVGEGVPKKLRAADPDKAGLYLDMRDAILKNIVASRGEKRS